MKQSEVTRKPQVTLPKNLAEKRGKPGDKIVLEQSGDALILRKSPSRKGKEEELNRIRRAIQRYSQDIPIIRKSVKRAESALIENPSRHLSSD